MWTALCLYAFVALQCYRYVMCHKYSTLLRARVCPIGVPGPPDARNLRPKLAHDRGDGQSTTAIKFTV